MDKNTKTSRLVLALACSAISSTQAQAITLQGLSDLTVDWLRDKIGLPVHHIPTIWAELELYDGTYDPPTEPGGETIHLHPNEFRATLSKISRSGRGLEFNSLPLDRFGGILIHEILHELKPRDEDHPLIYAASSDLVRAWQAEVVGVRYRFSPHVSIGPRKIVEDGKTIAANICGCPLNSWARRKTQIELLVR